EALHASGLIGLLLFILLCIAPILFVPGRWLAVASAWSIAQSTLLGLWFPLPLSLPLQAVALASVTGNAQGLPCQRGCRMLQSVVYLVLSALLMLLAAISLYHGQTWQRWQLAVEAGNPSAVSSACAPGIRGDDLALARLLRGRLAAYEKMSDAEQQQQHQPALQELARCLVERIPHTHTPLLIFTGLTLMAERHVTQQLHWAALPMLDLPTWQHWINLSLQKAPMRSDQAIPWLSHLAVSGQWETLRQQLTVLLQRQPEDAVGHYFLGILQLTRGEKEAGIGSLRRAIAGGVERFLPIDEAIRNLVADAPATGSP
ncbi:hypothetical protein, partial [Candidatus Magnetaquicoccus inordinatus]|uniref:hypothetical protein n=1 Tax=Candidatus Magnetaquicoccus inordinatus TaxID=2496818 RepID=UPI00187D23F4